MKKLNRKGFTLVELLAVIIILAIVVGITIPAITNIINDSKNSALNVACNSAADYLSDQYAMMNVDFNTANDNFTTLFSGNEDKVIELDQIVLTNAGFKEKNVEQVLAKIDSNGNVCVTVTTISRDSEYYSTTYWDVNGIAKEGAKNYSDNCSGPLALSQE